MKIFKFGGASVKDARGIRNLADIVRRESDELVIVVSAIGKTTNSLEWVAEPHRGIMEDLGLSDYDRVYDAFVSQGELQSTYIVSEYLNRCGLENVWLDATRILITDGTHRGANVDMSRTRQRLCEAMKKQPCKRYVIQGFIGGTEQGEITTLGREGSDYSAAVFGAVLGAESVTIWKDVPGVLTADPRKFTEAKLIPEMNYQDALRLTESGAQIIHPKTIYPLMEQGIPLHVRPFFSPEQSGTIIDAAAKQLDIPVMWEK